MFSRAIGCSYPYFRFFDSGELSVQDSDFVSMFLSYPHVFILSYVLSGVFLNQKEKGILRSCVLCMFLCLFFVTTPDSESPTGKSQRH